MSDQAPRVTPAAPGTADAAPRTAHPAPRTPSVLASSMRVFDLSLGQMLWSRRSVFLGLLLGAPVFLAINWLRPRGSFPAICGLMCKRPSTICSEQLQSDFSAFTNVIATKP